VLKLFFLPDSDFVWQNSFKNPNMYKITCDFCLDYSLFYIARDSDEEFDCNEHFGILDER